MQLVSLSTIRHIPVRSSAPQPDSFPRATKRKSVPPSPKHTHPSHLTPGIPEQLVHPGQAPPQPHGRTASPRRRERFRCRARQQSAPPAMPHARSLGASSVRSSLCRGPDIAGTSVPPEKSVRQLLPHSRPDAPSRLHRRTRGTCPPPCAGASGPPRLSSAFFRCEPPHGGRTPMTRPKPAAGRLRETGLPQQPQTFSSHSQSPAIVSKTNFYVEAPITSPRNDGFLNINLETWGHRSNSNISTSLFP